jgi:septum formation protein
MPGQGDMRAPADAGAPSPWKGEGRGGGPLRLILGSASPRRRDLLAQIGVVPDEVRAARIDETPGKGELPRVFVQRMAREKAAAIPATPDELVLTADTDVSIGRRILGKPVDEAEAVQFLLMLSGRRHRVMTAVCLMLGSRTWERRVETRIKFKRLSDAEVSAYIRSGQWHGKAGGYDIRGMAAAFIPEIYGSYTNVVGLPLCETAGLLQGAGYPVSFEGAAG